LTTHGLKVSHLFWAGGFTGSDGRTYRESVDDAREAIHTAASLNCKTLAVCSGARAGHTHNHARRLLLDALRELTAEAAEAGITLALEPMHPRCAEDWTFLTSVDDVLGVLDRLGSPQVKMVLDVYHLGQEEGFLARIPEMLSHVALVQLGDARQPPDGIQNRCRLGEGKIPLPAIIAALQAGGYDGYYDVELLGE
jgi:sugar phosphate isomerase/epimerase